MSECWFRFIICLTFLLVYLLFGAGMYSKLEHGSEKEEYTEMILYWKDFKAKHNISSPLMRKFLDSHYYTCQHGDKGQHDGKQWDYSSSLFFAGTVVTTIGYGHVAPHTIGGRLFTIVYAYFGIPMMLGLLNVIAEMLLALLRTLKEKIKKIQTIFQYEVFLSANLTTVLFACFMMAVYGHREKSWNFLDSFYFAFVTMTTIGFGDYVPGQDAKDQSGFSGILYESINLIVYLLAVVVWYFQAHVTAQILKSKMRFLYSLYLMKIKNKGEECSDDEDVESEESEESVAYKPMARRISLPNAKMCMCTCTCGGLGGLPNRGLFNKGLNKPPNNYNRHGQTNGGPPSDSANDSLMKKLLSLQEEEGQSTNSSSSLVNSIILSNVNSPVTEVKHLVMTPEISKLCYPDLLTDNLHYKDDNKGDSDQNYVRTHSFSPEDEFNSISDESYLLDLSSHKRLTKSAGDITNISDKQLIQSKSTANLAKVKRNNLLAPSVNGTPGHKRKLVGSTGNLASQAKEFSQFQTLSFDQNF